MNFYDMFSTLGVSYRSDVGPRLQLRHFLSNVTRMSHGPLCNNLAHFTPIYYLSDSNRTDIDSSFSESNIHFYPHYLSFFFLVIKHQFTLVIDESLD